MCAAKPGSLPDSGASSGSSSRAAVSQTPPGGGRMKAPTSSPPSNAAPAASNLKPPVKAYNRKVCNFSSRCGIGFLESSFACGHVLGLGFDTFVMWLQLDLNFEIGEFEVCALLQIMSVDAVSRTEIPKASNVWPNMGELRDGVFNAFLTRNRDA